MVAGFPIAKLGVLAVKQISKPITRAIKRTAQKNPLFKNYVATPPAQALHWCEVRSKMWMLGLPQPKRVPPLTEAMSIEMGSNIVGEMVVFLSGVILILTEFIRQGRKDHEKHERHRINKEKLKNEIFTLTERVKSQSEEINYLKQKLRELD
ncbi:putative OPA3-like protein CG13603 [Drosophila busckii]|uniref:putative OPA3-like protein CG13603 n=1 Tax=Drosophila busckii TaxID=30019 RepID=UPI00083EDD12|nr:putative OPA3-like protein CG13603 [Drosophila busckii]